MLQVAFKTSILARIIPIWKPAPFLRMLTPLVTGILVQWYLPVPKELIILSILSFSASFLAFYFLPSWVNFRLRPVQGISLNLLVGCLGLLVTWHRDIRHDSRWFGHFCRDSVGLVVRINEPLIERNKTFKAEGIVETVIDHGQTISCVGKLLLYFTKDSLRVPLEYGDKILISKQPQPLKNTGNPGAFNYEQYGAFQLTYHSVFLKQGEWVLLKGKDINYFNRFVFSARDNILAILQKKIAISKDELGIAEALLIGYMNDLDKDLIQAYSNTGVVHIIAISGMHLGLIYLMLSWLFARIPGIKQSKIIRSVFILSCLWVFSLITGGSASVIRSAVMFTFITTGKTFSKRSSIFNSLAGSAFVMLCYNPYFLWDVGFQLSYLAVVGIIVFQRPIYNWVHIPYKGLDKVWELIAVSLAAQMLTFPVCIYYFHQFPNLFLITNIIAVPLSTVILFVEIALVAMAGVPYINVYLGKLTEWLVWLMNKIIVSINGLPFAVWNMIHTSLILTLILYAIVIGLSGWLLQKEKRMLQFTLLNVVAYLMLLAFNNWQGKNQQQFIVYNIPHHRAIDIAEGDHYHFIGDSILTRDSLTQNIYLKPSRIQLQLYYQENSGILSGSHLSIFQSGNTRIMLIDSGLVFNIPEQQVNVDIVVFSNSPKFSV